jgi:hypothetical protein
MRAGGRRRYDCPSNSAAVHAEVLVHAPALPGSDALAFAFLIRLVHRPFWDDHLDDLDCLCCISILLHVIASLFYNNQDFVKSPDKLNVNGTGARMLEYVLLTINVCTLATFAALFVKALIEHKFKRETIKILSTHVSRIVLTVKHNVSEMGAGFVELIETLKVTSPKLDENVRIFHSSHGLGTIRSVACDNERQKPVLVCFDSGAEHHYSMEQADAKLTVVFDPALNTPNFVHAKHFKRAVNQVLSKNGTHLSSAGLEAVFLLLKMVDGNDGAAGNGPLISVGMVTHAPLNSTRCHAALSVPRAAFFWMVSFAI